MNINQFKNAILFIPKNIGKGIKKLSTAANIDIGLSDESCGLLPLIAMAIIVGMGKGKGAKGFMNDLKKGFKINFEIQEGKGDEVTIIASNPQNGHSVRETRVKGANISFSSKRNIYVGLGLNPEHMKSYCN